MDLEFTAATVADAAGIFALRKVVAEKLTAEHGRGHWSNVGTVKGVLATLRSSRVFVAHEGSEIVAMFSLGTKKPWAIDTSYFTPCRKAVYLHGLAVDPRWRGKGLGRRAMEEARQIAAEWPADAIRLDAYDTAAGAGGFYSRCGYREVGRVAYRGTPLVYYELVLPI